MHFLTLILLASLTSFLFPAQAQTWQTTVVSTEEGMQPNLGVDPLGNLHLAWSTYAGSHNQMNYATNQSGGWTVARPFFEQNSDHWSPVVEGDSLGCFHIAVRADAGDVHYWTNNTDRWSQGSTYVPRDTRYDLSGHGHHVNLEIFEDTTPQIFREMDGRLFHQRNTQQIFQDSTSATPDHDGSVIHQWTTAMEEDVLHAAVRLVSATTSESYIGYTRKERGSYTDAPWDPVEVVVVNAGWPSLTVKDGVAHLVYVQNNAMHYTERTGTGWSTPVSMGGTSDPAHSGIGIDDNGGVHAVWVESDNGVYYTNNIGGSWAAPSLAGTADGRDWDETHMDDKLALDTKDNTVYIAYTANNQVVLSHTSDFTLRDETAGGTTTLAADSDFTPPAELTVALASEACPLTVLQFTVTDAGDDGLPTEVETLFVQTGPEQHHNDERSSWYFKEGLGSFVAGARLSFGSGQASVDVDPDWILDNKLVFRSEGETIFSIPEGGAETVSVQVWMQTLNANWNGITTDLVVRGSYDIQTSESGSSMAFDQPLVGTGPMPYRDSTEDTGTDDDPCPDTEGDTGAPTDTDPDSGTDSGSDSGGNSEEDSGGDPSETTEGAEVNEEGGCGCTQAPLSPMGRWLFLAVGLTALSRRQERSNLVRC